MDLEKFLDEPMKVPAWVSNTQAVERAIRRVPEAGKVVRGEDRRDRMVLGQVTACEMLPVRNSKKNYVKMANKLANAILIIFVLLIIL